MLFDNLEIDIKKNILACIIDKLNSNTLKQVLNFCEKENIKITLTNKYYMFNINTLNDLQIKHLWVLVMN